MIDTVMPPDGEPVAWDHKIEEGYRYTAIYSLDGSHYRWRIKIPGYTPLTPQQIEERRLAAKAKREAKLRRDMHCAIALACDYCHELMGYVAECDLNGSQFFCLDCMAKVRTHEDN